MSLAGLLVGGQIVPVPGVVVDNARTAPWATLSNLDRMARPRDTWIRQCIVHTTKGIWPQRVIPGAGPVGRDKRVADFWARDPTHSAAHACADSDGTGACYADLADVIAYHATVSNRWSWGIEVYQELDGGIYEAALAAAVRMVLAGCRALGIQFQIPRTRYLGGPLARMKDGGSDVVGILGHRDNTDRRGRGDPGDDIFDRLEEAGCERFDLADQGDRTEWRERQRMLRERGHDDVSIDGIPGPKTTAALRAEGWIDGIWALGRRS